MRKITKGHEAPELTQWRRRHPVTRYSDLGGTEKRAIRRDCLMEQKGLCAFCCAPVSVDDGHNAHLRSQHQHPQNTLDWDNLVASCCQREHCGIFQGTKELPLTPLMAACETELTFYLTGKIKGTTDRAKQSISALNLDCKALRQRRKWAINAFFYDKDYFPPEEDVSSWGPTVWQQIIEDCGNEVSGTLTPYAPVLASIARQLLGSCHEPSPYPSTGQADGQAAS